MPPTDRVVPSFAAEPQQLPLPVGEWAQTLRTQFIAAAAQIDADEPLGEFGVVRWFPDRTYAGRTYVPGIARSAAGYEVFGFVSYLAAGPGDDGQLQFESIADYTGDTAENNPDWSLDLNSWTIARWRGENGQVAEMSLIWGVPIVRGGAIVTAELANLAVDQCDLDEGRFTLIAPDSYRDEYLEIKLWNAHGSELAVESLYDDEESEDSEDEDGSQSGAGSQSGTAETAIESEDG